jgi:DNA-binding SARP family transcriptional activator
MTAAERQASIERRTHFAEVWGTPESLSVDFYAPSMAGNAEFRAWHERYERLSAGFDSLRDLLIQMMDVDVSDVLPTIDVPVLVLHRRDDGAIPIEYGREVAELLPNAEFVELDGADHFAYLGDMDGWMDQVERWVTGAVAPRPAVLPTGEVQVRTLGRFGVTVGGREVTTSEWGSRRARTLLKRLVVARGWPVTRDELADALWPDEPDHERLGARLSVQLSAVRRVLGGGVVADRQTVALDLDHVSTDLETLLTATDDQTVIDVYRGEFLPAERYEDWAAPIREQARSHFTRAAHRRLSELLAAGESAGAVELAESVLAADPYDEAAYAALADAHERAGDPAAAERTRQRRRDAIGDLFGTDS